MLIAGAGGFGKQLLPELRKQGLNHSLVFFDENPAIQNLYEFRVIHSEDLVQEHFAKSGPDFAVGVGKSLIRHKLTRQLVALGGKPRTICSEYAHISGVVEIGEGCAILKQAILEVGVVLEEGVLLNLNALVCHETHIGMFSEISPGAILLGACRIGKFSFVGAGAIVNPLVRIGDNVVVGAGAVVNRDVPDNALVMGVPARVVKFRDPIPPG